jgi:hypothetical protein
MALPKTVRMSRSAERARKTYLDAMRKSALAQIRGPRTLADTMATLQAMDAQHKYFLKETARLSRASDWLKKRGASEEKKALRARLGKALRKIAKEDSVNRGVAKSIRQALEASPWK